MKRLILYAIATGIELGYSVHEFGRDFGEIASFEGSLSVV